MIQEHYGPQFNVDSFQTRFRHHADRRFDVRVPVKPGAAELAAWAIFGRANTSCFSAL